MIATAQVQSIQEDNKALSTSKQALDLYEAFTIAKKSKALDLEQTLIDQVIDILKTHPVRSMHACSETVFCKDSTSDSGFIHSVFFVS